MTPFLVDTTLRDGLQAPGISLSTDEKHQFIQKLHNAGFGEIEGGIPITGKDAVSFLRDIRDWPGRVISWCRADERDIKASERAGTGAVHISFPISERHLKTTGKTMDAVEDSINSLILTAYKNHDFVSVGFMDCFRTDPRKLNRVIRLALNAGALRIRIADSVGIGTPSELRRLAAKLKPKTLKYLEFHGHNDLGLATANALEAILLGFGGVSGTIGGLGERAGNLAWEQLALAADFEEKIHLNINSGAVFEMARSTLQTVGESIPPGMPILGERCRLHESGIHAAAHFRDDLAFMPYRPQEYGLPPVSVVAGSGSGKGSLAGMLKEFGIVPTAHQVKQLASELQKITGSNGGFLYANELLRVYEKIQGVYP